MDQYADIAAIIIDKDVSQLQKQLHVSNKALAFILGNLAKDYELKFKAEEYIKEKGDGSKTNKTEHISNMSDT